MLLSITQIDTACMLLDINGFRIVTDPAFDAGGGVYQGSAGRILYKYLSPAIEPEDLGGVDLVLLSHDQHMDNLDLNGRAFIKTVPRVLSTRESVERLGHANVTGLDEWETYRPETDKVPGLRITATPCMHGSDEALHQAAGHVIGFVLEWDDQRKGVLYISGDTVYFKGVEEVAARYKVDTAILHVGRAGFPELIGERYLTFTAEEAIRTARLMKVNKLIPTHLEGWEHFQENPGYAHKQMRESGRDGEEYQLIWLTPGKAVKIEI